MTTHVIIYVSGSWTRFSKTCFKEWGAVVLKGKKTIAYSKNITSNIQSTQTRDMIVYCNKPECSEILRNVALPTYFRNVLLKCGTANTTE